MEHVTTFSEMEPHILFQRDDAYGICTVLSLTIAPFAGDVHAHRHAGATAQWYVIRGIVALSIGQRTITICRGQSADIPANRKYNCWNPGPEPVDVLVLLVPDGT